MKRIFTLLLTLVALGIWPDAYGTGFNALLVLR